MRKLILLFCLSIPAFGAISATMQWDMRTTGSNSNSGGYDPGVVSPAHSGISNQVLYKASPGSSTPWDVYALIFGTIAEANYGNACLVVYDGTSAIIFGFNAAYQLQTAYGTLGGGFTSINTLSGVPPNSPVWLNVHNDGANLIFSYSFDGVAFDQLSKFAITAHLTAATYYGLLANSQNSLPASVTALSWASAMTAN